MYCFARGIFALFLFSGLDYRSFKLFDIVYQAVELPLTLNFRFASKAKAVQPFVAADVGEDRFDNGHPMAVDLLAFVAIDTGLHPVGIVMGSRCLLVINKTCLL
jgi:hypothetical protein